MPVQDVLVKNNKSQGQVVPVEVLNKKNEEVPVKVLNKDTEEVPVKVLNTAKVEVTSMPAVNVTLPSISLAPSFLKVNSKYKFSGFLGALGAQGQVEGTVVQIDGCWVLLDVPQIGANPPLRGWLNLGLVQTITS